MKRSTFNIIFYIKRQDLKRDGRAPIMGRITINKCAKQFTCCMAVLPEIWDAKGHKAKGNSDEARQINRELQDIRKDITKHYWEIRRGIGPLTAERVKAAFFGEDKSCRTLLQVFAQYNEQLAVMKENRLRTISTCNRYHTVYNHLEKFLAMKYKFKDIALVDLHSGFITEFELYLRKNKKCSNNTVWGYMMPLKKMITIARNNGWLELNPFGDYRIVAQKTERNYLTTKELGLLINTKLDKRILEIIRDLFLFCCFTGVSCADLPNLLKQSIVKSEEGIWWLSYKRQKTGLNCNLRLLEIPFMIIQKYKGVTRNGRLLLVPCYATLRKGIKKVIAESGIKKNITWHMSRHTYATEICMLNGVPIETISKMLGHADIKTTQIYAKLSDTVVERDMGHYPKSSPKYPSFLMCHYRKMADSESPPFSSISPSAKNSSPIRTALRLPCLALWNCLELWRNAGSSLYWSGRESWQRSPLIRC